MEVPQSKSTPPEVTTEVCTCGREYPVSGQVLSLCPNCDNPRCPECKKVCAFCKNDGCAVCLEFDVETGHYFCVTAGPDLCKAVLTMSPKERHAALLKDSECRQEYYARTWADNSF